MSGQENGFLFFFVLSLLFLNPLHAARRGQAHLGLNFPLPLSFILSFISFFSFAGAVLK